MNQRDFWEKAYREFGPTMLGICRRYIPNRASAEDVMHEAFLTAINKSDSYAGTGNFYGWLRKITINRALMHLKEMNRLRNNQQLYVHEIENIMNEEGDSDGIRSVIQDAGFEEQDLLEAIDHLPDHHRMVFNMYVLDEYSHKQIAEELNISEGTSKSHLSRARKSIQQMLYQKALHKPVNEKKKKRAAMLLFAGGGDMFIDNLCRKKLQSFTMKPSMSFRELEASVNWLKVSPFRTGFLSRFRYLIIGTSALISACLIIYMTENLRDTSSPVSRIPNPAKTEYIHQEVKAEPAENAAIDQHPSADKQVKENLPVIIKKIVYKHIIVHDTIRITDSTHVH